VTGYTVSRNGTPLGTTALTTFEDPALAAGTAYQYTVAAFDEAGNTGPSATVSATTVEATPPTVGLPVTTFLSGSQLETTNVPVVVTWTATDSSGLSLVELQQSKNAGAWTTVALAGPTSTSVTLMRAPGSTYRFRVRATDTVANTSTWMTGATFTLSAKQEGSTQIAYSAGWTTAANTNAYGGSLRYATSSTATATFTFTGSSVGWVAPRAGAKGMADVFVDGVFAATIDLYSATSQPRSVVFARSWATAGSHTLQIRVKGTLGRPRVDVDAFLVAN